MIVRCVENQIRLLDDPETKAHISRYVNLKSVGLKIGQDYYVFGVEYRQGVPWFLVCEECSDEYPKPQCHVFFDIIDSTIGTKWNFTERETNIGTFSHEPGRWITWGSDTQFLERLVDGDSDAVSYFSELKVHAARELKRIKGQEQK